MKSEKLKSLLVRSFEFVVRSLVLLALLLFFFAYELLTPNSQLRTPNCYAQEEMRPAAVAGQFYPEDKRELAGMINRFLFEADKKYIDGELVALIVPHAGYIYSGQVAGYAYKQIVNEEFDDIILLGPSHHARFKGASVGNYRLLSTPLGDLQTDVNLIGALLKEKEFAFNQKADIVEHSLEIQFPFLKEVTPESKVVPILIGNDSLKNADDIARALVNHVKGRKVLLIASTDLSHYHPYNEALVMDKQAIRALLSLDPEALHKEIGSGVCQMCGGGAVETAIVAARMLGANKALLLKYANSGDTSGTKKSVVGYAAIAIYKIGN